MLCPAWKPDLMWNCLQISGKFPQWTGTQSSPDAWSLYALWIQSYKFTCIFQTNKRRQQQSKERHHIVQEGSSGVRNLVQAFLFSGFILSSLVVKPAFLLCKPL